MIISCVLHFRVFSSIHRKMFFIIRARKTGLDLACRLLRDFVALHFSALFGWCVDVAELVWTSSLFRHGSPSEPQVHWDLVSALLSRYPIDPAWVELRIHSASSVNDKLAEYVLLDCQQQLWALGTSANTWYYCVQQYHTTLSASIRSLR